MATVAYEAAEHPMLTIDTEGAVDNDLWVSGRRLSDYARLELNDFKLKDAPSSLHYIPEFVSREEEASIIESIKNVSEHKWIRDDNQHKQEYGRRIQNHDGKTEEVSESLPQWSELPINRVMALNYGFSDFSRPEFLRVNEYPVGFGIHTHLDINIPGRFNAIVTFGSTALLDFYEQPIEGQETSLEERYIGSVLMEPRSLLLVSRDMFKKMHGIKEGTHDLITDKVFNRPANMPVGTLLERNIRYSLALTCP